MDNSAKETTLPAAERPALILASTSRYRRELLERLRLPFEVRAPQVDETPLAGEPPAALAARLALAKARAVSLLSRETVVIGSDQVADLDGKPLGKPGGRERAAAQLHAMSGRRVVFHTGVAVVCAARGHEACAVVPVTVRVRRLDGRRDRPLPEPGGALRLRGQREIGGARHRAARIDRVGRPDRAGRPAADPHLRHAARGRHRPARVVTPPPRTGRLLLVPAPLDFGLRGMAPAPLDESLPLGVIRQAAQLSHWVVENAKSARAFLGRVGAVVPLARPLQEIGIVELPRPPKGAGDLMASRHSTVTTDAALAGLLAPALQGHDIGLLSEAGLPAVADPGALVVQQAHRQGIAVVALPGASSIVLALAASGLNGQSFAFAGYLPTEAEQRAARIRELEAVSRRWQQTQLAIETPYRNAALLAALLAHLQPSTRLAVSSGLTLADGWTRERTVEAWRRAGDAPPKVEGDVPAVYAWLAG